MYVVSGSALHRRGGYGYFEWLCDLVGIHDGIHSDKEDLLWQLHSIDFRYSIPTDFNRISDAMRLRDLYSEEHNAGDIGPWPISVFVVLVGLSKTLADDVLGDNHDGDLMRRWFWKMMTNLGVMKFNGNKHDRGKVCTIVEIWMNRDFEPDGGGSPFPLKHPTVDQRRVEIWKQVCDYMVENPDMESL